jgi:hypothetical protein
VYDVTDDGKPISSKVFHDYSDTKGGASETAANLCIGGHDHNRLFICASTSLCGGRKHAQRGGVACRRSAGGASSAA